MSCAAHVPKESRRRAERGEEGRNDDVVLLRASIFLSNGVVKYLSQGRQGGSSSRWYRRASVLMR